MKYGDLKKAGRGWMFWIACVGMLNAENSFEKVCVPCHLKTDVSLQKTFMNALLVYGGKENMKAGLAYYFRNPRHDTSVMGEDLIRKNGIKKPMSIEKKILDEALEQYWKKYTVIGKID